MSKMLLIQNQGVAPVEGYTTLGFSSTRGCGVDGAIGQFGSGSKHAINLCLRHGLKLWVYCGNTRLEFGLEEETVSDGLTETVVQHVCFRKDQNSAFKRTGWVLDFGVIDWTDVGMGLREFVSNAIDRTLREEAQAGRADYRGAIEDGRLAIKIVDDADRKAKAGFTRIYVEVNDDVQAYHDALPKYFLHLRDEAFDVGQRLLVKPTGTDSKTPIVYRRGVYVRELDAQGASRAIFDYNMKHDEVEIDECRNSNDYTLRVACVRVLRDATQEQIETLLASLVKGDSTFEAGLDADYLYSVYTQPTNERKLMWQAAWDKVAPNTVATDSGLVHAQIKAKGYEAVTVSSSWCRAFARLGIRTAEVVLSVGELRGRIKVAASEHAVQATEWAWSVLSLAGLTGDKDKPQTFCYVEQPGATPSDDMGCCDAEGVHYKHDVATTKSKDLLKTALDTVAQYITGKEKLSRETKALIIEALVELAA